MSTLARRIFRPMRFVDVARQIADGLRDDELCLLDDPSTELSGDEGTDIVTTKNLQKDEDVHLGVKNFLVSDLEVHKKEKEEDRVLGVSPRMVRDWKIPG